MRPGALERQSRHGMIWAWAHSEARVGQVVDAVAGLVGQMVQEPMRVINLNRLTPDRAGWQQSDAAGRRIWSPGPTVCIHFDALTSHREGMSGPANRADTAPINDQETRTGEHCRTHNNGWPANPVQ